MASLALQYQLKHVISCMLHNNCLNLAHGYRQLITYS